MKKKILTKHILMALAMAAMVPAGQAWAADIALDGNINLVSGEYTTNGSSKENLKDIKDKAVIITKTPLENSERDFAMVIQNSSMNPYSGITWDKDFYVTVTNSEGAENADGLHIMGAAEEGAAVTIGDFSGAIHAANSDGISIVNEAQGSNTLIVGSIGQNGGLTVDHGNGIRASVFVGKYVTVDPNESYESVINVTGATNITINGEKITAEETFKSGQGDVSLPAGVDSVTVSGGYSPAAVYAGDDMRYITSDLISSDLIQQMGVPDDLKGTAQGMFKDMFGNVTAGNESKGQGEITLNGDTNLLITKSTGVDFANQGGYGLYAGKNGTIQVNGNLRIQSEADNSYGIAARNANLIYGDTFDTIVSANEEYIDDIKSKLYTLSSMAGVFGIKIDTDCIKFDETSFTANLTNLDASQNHGTSVTLGNGKDVSISMQGDNSYAMYAEGVDDDGEQVSISGNINSLYAEGDMLVENGGLIDLHVTGNAQNYLEGDVKAYGTKSNKNATVTLSVDNALAGQGTLAAANDGIVNLELGANSNWTGRADDYGDANDKGSVHEKFVNSEFENITSGGAVNLTMGNDAVWNVDGQSWITNLTASGDNMFINLLGTEADRNANADALTIYNLKGHATFAMHLDGERSGSDMLYIKNTDGSSYDVYLDELVTAEDMSRNGEFKDGLRFATVGNNNVTFNVYSLNQGIYNLKYQVKQTEYDTTETKINAAYNGKGDDAKPGSDMVEDFFTNNKGEPPSIQNEGLAAQDTTEVNTTGNFWNYNLFDVQDRQISDAGKTIIAMSKVNYSNAVYMDRLNKRMGEARYIDGDDGLWVRMRHDRIGKDDAFRSMNTMFELGYDWHAKGQKDGEHRQGVAFDYMRGTADYKNVAGDGDVRRAGVRLYDTWLGDKGHYSDYVVKYGRLSNDFDIYALSNPGEKISGDYDNDVWSVSAEYGRKKDIGNDWYFEPQVQAQYAYVTSADYTTSQDTKVHLDSIDSLIGRVGFRLGRDTDEANTVYFKADILHEFLGGQSIRAMDSTGTLSTTYENEGTWYDVGFGFSHRMSKDKYMFLDVEKLFGNDNEDTYQVNIGLNVAF